MEAAVVKNIDVNISTLIFKSKNGINTIYEATCAGEPCYAVEHVPTGHIELIDHDEKLLKSVIGKIGRTGTLICEYKQSGRGLLKFRLHGRERRITLRRYVFAKYSGLDLGKVRNKKIEIISDSLDADNILDIRSCNLCEAGACRPKTKRRTIEIVCNPNNTDDKYIAIRIHNRGDNKVEYVQYSPELYEMLSRPTYCGIGYNKHNERATVVVHYGNDKNGYNYSNLARFICIYKEYFPKYKGRTGAVKRFIHDYDMLSGLYGEKYDAAHINSCKWNNCFENIMIMDTEINTSMSNVIKCFSGNYSIYTALNKSGEILIEYGTIDLLHGGRLVTRLYKCRTPEDFLDWQRVMLGKELTQKLQVATMATKSGIRQELTPCGMIKTGSSDRETAKNNEPDLWVWAEHRDKLLSMDDNDFFHYRKQRSGTIDDTINTVMAYLYGVIV